MKFANIFLAGSTAWACATESGEPLYAVENFITSDAVEFELLMDSVMGGVSQATLDSENGILKFDGRLSLENNGGFASFNGWIGRRLTNYRGIRVSARTDTPGRDFQMYLQPATGDKSPAFWYNKVSLTNQFQSFEIDFNEFDFNFMNWTPSWMPSLSGASTRSVGMIIADKNTEPFSAEVQVIEGLI